MATTAKTDGRRNRAGQSSARRELVEAQIFEEAARLFAERGFAGTTPQDIAEAVGISRQSLYYYVKSKDEILARLVSEMAVQIVSEMKEIAESDLEPPQRLHALVRHLATDRAVNRTRFRLLDRSESALSPELAAEYLQGRRAALAIMVAVIEDGVARGWFRVVESRIAALSVIGMCNWVAWWFEPGPDRPVAPIADQLAEGAVAMLARPGSSTPASDPRAVVDEIKDQLERLTKLL